MSMIHDVMDALADALTDLPGCDQIVPRLNTKPNGACIDIYPATDSLEEVDERGFEGSGAFVLTVRARVDLGDTDAAQDILLEWMDHTNPYGVAAFLEDDPTLNGVASSVDAGAASGFVQFIDPNGAVSRLGAQWTVRVLPAHS